MELVEILSILGTPARAGSRIILFLPRYCIDGFSALRNWQQNTYAFKRFGPSCRWRLWLIYDCRELEELETLINRGQDAEILKLRETQLESFRLVALVGALLASVALQALNLPLITSTTFFVRGMFTIAFMLSILATFFTCIQQREFGVIRTAPELRAWLSNGVRYVNGDGDLVYQSSMAALNLLDSPYELLSIAIASMMGGVAAYLGSAWVYEVRLSAGGRLGDVAVIVAFAVGTVFAFALFPALLGSKAKEIKVAGRVLEGFEISGDGKGDGRVSGGLPHGMEKP
ncbi:hypothetical protein EK21DRAFT_74388 [Setomelanomma holmii]|uniref:Uncharacterized protein n=1 Tax=Setomelanomma holmii TaxID=210430 RepID=A0A9P4H0U9_9PLEO|nr:hypothetical protein EK21DRAFT_74388 [Setomelanomma holmii]